MNCNFHVGQKVVCVNDGETERSPPRGGEVIRGLDGLSAGVIYTIRDIYIEPIWGGVAVRLVELLRPPAWDIGVSPYEPGFNPARFRPVVERGTEKGMSILRNLLNKTGKRFEVVA